MKKILVLDKSITGKDTQLAFSQQILETLQELGYDCFYHIIRSIPDMEKIIKIHDFDKIFLCTINDWGNNGTLQRVLDYYKIDYTFSNGIVSELCYNKQQTKDWLKSKGYSVPDSYQWSETGVIPNIKFPCIMKTFEGESGNGVYYIANQLDIDKHKGDGETHLLEEYLTGEEYTVSILKGVVGNPALIKKQGTILNHSTDSFELDYLIKQDIRNLISVDFELIFKEMGLRDACRIDFIVKNMQYKILEINSMPVITPNSVYTKSMEDFSKSRYSFNQIISTICGPKE